MKKIAILLFILMFLTGGYASAYYFLPEPDSEGAFLEKALLKISGNIIQDKTNYQGNRKSFDNAFESVDDVFILINPAQISPEYFKSNHADPKFDLFPDFLKMDSLQERILRHFNAGSFKRAKIHFIEKDDLFNREIYEQVNGKNSLLVMVVFKWGTYPKENDANTNWSIRLLSYYYRNGLYNSPHLLLMNTGTEIFFPKCPDCSFQVDQSTHLDNFVRGIARNIKNQFN